MKNFCIVNSNTNIVEAIVTVEGETALPNSGYYEVEVEKHDPNFYGMKYVNGEFIEV